MLASVAHRVDDLVGDRGHDFAMEPKLDGHRLLAHVGEDGVRLYSRGGQNQTGYLPKVAEDLEAHFPAGTVLDGEIVALGVPEEHAGDGWSSVQRVMGSGTPERAVRMQEGLTFIVFDLLAHGGIDVRSLAFRQRRDALEAIFDGAEFSATALIPQYDATAENYTHMLDLGFEGAMVKRWAQPYRSGKRARGWSKVKPTDTLDGVVIGSKPGQGSFTGLIGSVEFGQYKNGKLVHRGFCSGMDYATRLDISSPDGSGAIKPEYLGRVIEVKHNGVFASGDIRFGRFVRFRTDKTPEECAWA